MTPCISANSDDQRIVRSSTANRAWRESRSDAASTKEGPPAGDTLHRPTLNITSPESVSSDRERLVDLSLTKQGVPNLPAPHTLVIQAAAHAGNGTTEQKRAHGAEKQQAAEHVQRSSLTLSTASAGPLGLTSPSSLTRFR